MNIFTAPMTLFAVLGAIIILSEIWKTFKRPDELVGLYKIKRKYGLVIVIIMLPIAYIPLIWGIWALWTR